MLSATTTFHRTVLDSLLFAPPTPGCNTNKSDTPIALRDTASRALSDLRDMLSDQRHAELLFPSEFVAPEAPIPSRSTTTMEQAIPTRGAGAASTHTITDTQQYYGHEHAHHMQLTSVGSETNEPESEREATVMNRRHSMFHKHHGQQQPTQNVHVPMYSYTEQPTASMVTPKLTWVDVNYTPKMYQMINGYYVDAPTRNMHGQNFPAGPRAEYTSFTTDYPHQSKPAGYIDANSQTTQMSGQSRMSWLNHSGKGHTKAPSANWSPKSVTDFVPSHGEHQFPQMTIPVMATTDCKAAPEDDWKLAYAISKALHFEHPPSQFDREEIYDLLDRINEVVQFLMNIVETPLLEPSELEGCFRADETELHDSFKVWLEQQSNEQEAFDSMDFPPDSDDEDEMLGIMQLAEMFFQVTDPKSSFHNNFFQCQDDQADSNIDRKEKNTMLINEDMIRAAGMKWFSTADSCYLVWQEFARAVRVEKNSNLLRAHGPLLKIHFVREDIEPVQLSSDLWSICGY